MIKLAIVAAGAFWLAAGSAFAAAPDCPVVGAYYRVVFTEDYRAYYDLDTDNTYIIKVDAISRSPPRFHPLRVPAQRQPVLQLQPGRPALGEPPLRDGPGTGLGSLTGRGDPPRWASARSQNSWRGSFPSFPNSIWERSLDPRETLFRGR